MAQLSWTEYLKIEDLTEQIDEGFCVLNSKGQIQYSNSHFVQMLGYSLEDILGKDFHSFMYSIEKESIQAVEKVTTLLSKDGTYIDTKLRIRPINDATLGWYVLVSKLGFNRLANNHDFFKALEYATPRIAIVGRDLKFKYINIPLTDFSSEDMKRISILDGVEKKYSDGLRDAVEAVFEEGIPGLYEISELRSDSEEIWLSLHISPIKVNNIVESVVMTGVNITDRVLTERALREEELRLRTILEQTLIGIAIVSSDPVQLLYANNQFCKILGYSLTDLLDTNTDSMTELVYNENRDSLVQYLRKCQEQENVGETIQIRLYHKDGSIRWVELSAGRILYKGNVALQLSIVDITKRLEMEDGLTKSKMRERTLLQSLNDLVIVHDENDCYAEVFTGNPDILLTSPNNYLGHHITEVLPESIAPQYLEAVRAVRSTGSSRQLDYPLKIGSSTHWFSSIMTLHEDKQSVVVAVRDITARYQAEETLQRERRFFHELAETFINAKDVTEISENFLGSVVENFGFDLGIYTHYIPKDGILRRTFTIGDFTGPVPLDVYVNDPSFKTFLIGYVFTEKKALFIQDVGNELVEKPFLNRIYKHGGKSVLAFPILNERQEILGIASFANHSIREFSSDERELFAIIAKMLGTALEQKAVELALKVSERKYRELITDIPEGIGIAGQDERFWFVNDSLARILGYTPEELVGMNILDLTLPEDVPTIIEQTRLRKEGKISSYTHRFIKKTGEQITVRVSGVPSKDDNGLIDGTVAIVTDITEQLKAEEALKDSEIRFRSVFEGTPVGMHLHEMSDDGELILVDVNQAADIVLRSKHDRLIGKPIGMVMPKRYASEELIERYYEIMRTGKPWSTETRMEKDGKVIGALQIQIFRTSPKTLVTSFLDISERFIAEMEIRKLNEELAQRVEERTAELAAVNKELEAFAYSVSHDLRAPLRAIDGFSTALLEDYADSINESGRDYLQRVRAAAMKMSSLIEDILSLSRVTRSEMDRSSVNLSILAREIIEEIRERDPKREVEVKIAGTTEARCDRRLMKIALQNLLENAWKFTHNVENPRIEFGSESIDDKIVFFLRDNGAGFDMKHKDKLFVPFQRLHMDSEFEGSGIGLATVQRILNRHGGLIWAESQVGKGATFYFTIPDKGERSQ